MCSCWLTAVCLCPLSNNTCIIVLFRALRLTLQVSIISHTASGISGMQSDTMYRSHDVKCLMTFSYNHVITCCERCDYWWECVVKKQRKFLFSSCQLPLNNVLECVIHVLWVNLQGFVKWLFIAKSFWPTKKDVPGGTDSCLIVSLYFGCSYWGWFDIK